MSIYEDLLRDTIDLHCHVDLEFSATAYRKREPEWEWLPKAEALGVRGVVFKSHWWPTVTAVPYIRQLYPGKVELWSSVTLNPVVGGAELWAVESAAALGARVVYLPTWGARQDIEHGGFSRVADRLFESFQRDKLVPISFLDPDGALSARGHELLRFCHERGLTLASGHVSWRETLAFAHEAQAIGFRRLVFTHPLAQFIDAPLAAAQRAAELGAWVEVCWTYIAPGRQTPEAVAEWIRAVGVNQVVITTDYFRSTTPIQPELLRFLLGTLYDAGLSASELRRMAAINPALALGVEPPA
jgi:hypothetical protein